MKKIIARYKEIRHLLQKDYYSLFMPATLSQPDGWQFHDPETNEGIFALFRCNSPEEKITVSLNKLAAGKYRAEDIKTGEAFEFTHDTPVEVILNQISDSVLYHYTKLD